MLYTLHVQLVNLGMEGLPNLTGCPGKVDQHAVRVIHIDLEIMRLQPARDSVAVLFCHPKPLSELLSREPTMKIRRRLVGKLIDESLQLALLFRRSLQLK